MSVLQKPNRVSHPSRRVTPQPRLGPPAVADLGDSERSV